ncbi:MAG: hypothetical protein AB7G93_13920 [Bdellovibrionales bacterium]
MRLFEFIGILVLGTVLARPALAERLDTCYRSEVDPNTRRRYQNIAQWESDRNDLWANAPARPYPWSLLWGHRVAEQESPRARKLGSDKRQHCYVGCRIANDVGYDVAVYAAYYKEEQDLLDCDPKSYFEPKDIEATVIGADLAVINPGGADAKYCSRQCRKKFSK